MMAEEVSISDAEEQFGAACNALRKAEAEEDRLELALFRKRKEVEEAREAKKKALDLLESLVEGKSSSLEQSGTAQNQTREAAAVGSGEKVPTVVTDHDVQVDVTIVGKNFVLRNGETKLFRGVIVAALEDQYRILYEDGDNEDIEAHEIDEYVQTNLTAEEEAAVRAEVAKHRQRKRAAAFTTITPSPPRKKTKNTHSDQASRKSSSSTPRPRKLNLSPENEWEEDMLQWLLNVPHGSSKKTCSRANAQQVIRQARKLLFGKGIPYSNWPEGVVFAKDETITLDDTDFDHLHKRAKAFEEEYGKDKGNGWLLQHPIHKLKLYQEFCSKEEQQVDEEASI